MRLRRSVSPRSSRAKNCREQRRPTSSKPVSTRSPPSSLLLTGIVLPVPPPRPFGRIPCSLSARPRHPPIVAKRTTEAVRAVLARRHVTLLELATKPDQHQLT